MACQHFHVDDLPVMPWKNGGGLTREVVCVPHGADMSAFDWRISIAHVASDGPFSCFPGVDRIITLLDGSGMRLRHPETGVEHLLVEPWAPWAFAGDEPVECSLLAGPCQDFNVMVRRDRFHAAVHCLRHSSVLSPAAAGLLLTCTGHASLQADGDSRPHSLAAGQGVWWADEPMHWSLRLEPGAVLIAVTITALST